MEHIMGTEAQSHSSSSQRQARCAACRDKLSTKQAVTLHWLLPLYSYWPACGWFSHTTWMPIKWTNLIWRMVGVTSIDHYWEVFEKNRLTQLLVIDKIFSYFSLLSLSFISGSKGQGKLTVVTIAKMTWDDFTYLDVQRFHRLSGLTINVRITMSHRMLVECIFYDLLAWLQGSHNHPCMLYWESWLMSHHSTLYKPLHPMVKSCYQH